MAKTKYNPLAAFREDPLAALKLATESGAGVDANEGKAVVSSDNAEAASLNASASSEKAGRSNAPVKPLSANLQTSRNTVYLYPEDLTKLRQLSGYASTEHGIRANDSMIVRAALSLLEPDVRLLHALKETEQLDRRRRGRA